MYLLLFLLNVLFFSKIVQSNSNCTAPRTLLTFDDLPATSSQALISNGYFGLNWSNVYYTYVYSQVSGSGYYAALSSGSYNVLNGYGNTMTIASTANAVFNASSFIAAAAWNDNLKLSINGIRNGSRIYSQNVTLQVTTSLLVLLNWTSIDTLSFSTSGGTVNPMFAGRYSGTQFAMDNLCVDISSIYSTTTGATNTSSTTSRPGSGGGGGGGGGGDGGQEEGVDIGISATFGKKPGMSLTIGEMTTPEFGGMIGTIVAALIILGILLWCFISTKCCTQSLNCNGCRRGGGC